MKQSPFLLTLALLAAGFAGCVNVPVDVANEPVDPAPTTTTFEPFTVPIPDFDFSTVVDPDHGNHQLPMLHMGGHGLKRVGHTGVGSVLPPGMSGSITQIDVWGDYAVVSGFEGDLGFIIVDIADPTNPKPLSYFPSVASDWTAKFSNDGQYVFLGCQVIAPLSPGGLAKGTCEDPDAVHGSTAKGGVTIVDVSDKSNPAFVTFVPTNAAHNLQVAEIDGVDYVFTNGVDIVRFDRETLTGEVVANVAGRHDSTVAQHPITGDWLLLTGTGELAIYNINDPAMPEPILEGFEGMRGWHEQTVIPQLVAGRFVVVLGGESFASVSGIPDEVGFLDITDPANPEMLSTWTPPFVSAVPWASYLYSIHEIATTPQGQVAISWYHGGVWVLDVSTEERLKEPATVAAYLPSEPINVLPAMFVQTPVPYVPFVWGASWDARGYLVIPDMHTGVYVLEPEWGLNPVLDGGQ